MVELLEQYGSTVAYYEYDPWGKLLSVKDASGNAITSATHIANINPIRYRGYYYDTESGFYYLKSRYYDPEICRFINPDSYLSTGQGVLGYNMFAYCSNCPVNFSDTQGTILCDATRPWQTGEFGILGGAAGFALGLAFADLLRDFFVNIATSLEDLFTAGESSYTITAPSLSVPKSRVQENEKSKEKEKVLSLPDDTIVYRWPDRRTLSVSYTPSDRDILFPAFGLSFSTIPKPGSAKTTIGQLNSTGAVFAILDSPLHVSVFPIGTTLKGWHDAGQNSIWSRAVQSVCTRWDGN